MSVSDFISKILLYNRLVSVTSYLVNPNITVATDTKLAYHQILDSSMEMENPTASDTATADIATETKKLKEKTNLLKQEKNKLIDEINELKKKVSEAEEERKTLKDALETEIESRKKETEELNEKIVELERELKRKDGVIESLEARIKKLEEDQNTLYISQVAYQFEQAICTYVLPDVFKKDQFATIKSLLKYLHGKSRLPRKIANPSDKLRKAKNEWDKVCIHLNLPTISEGDGDFTQWALDESSTPDIIKAICLLKMERLTIAHPRPISLKLAGEILPAVKDKMPPWHFELIGHFLAAIQKSIEEGGSEIYGEYFKLD